MSEYPKFSEWALSPTGDRREFYHRISFIVEPRAGERVVIPAGERTDIASIPWFVRWIYRTWGKHSDAALYHDHLIRTGKAWRYADKEFYRSLRATGNRPTKAWAMYAGVRIGSCWRMIKVRIFR